MHGFTHLGELPDRTNRYNQYKDYMKITKDNIKKAISSLRRCANEHADDESFSGYLNVTEVCNDVADFLDEIHSEIKAAKLTDEEIQNVMTNIPNACDDVKYQPDDIKYGIPDSTRRCYMIYRDANPLVRPYMEIGLYDGMWKKMEIKAVGRKHLMTLVPCERIPNAYIYIK